MQSLKISFVTRFGLLFYKDISAVHNDSWGAGTHTEHILILFMSFLSPPRHLHLPSFPTRPSRMSRGDSDRMMRCKETDTGAVMLSSLNTSTATL